ncbi:DUF6035 family protein [Frateuria sp. GZRR35]|uniref:DUF6035 family protein n=1 Tax=Frateuria TaxID=70411 RepID=UPI002260B45A|nr:DUF6035 family protein [Frateuria sp. STR12]MCX7514249.1 DUF6035 family protein [Frateuria sp. STR12]
MAAHHFEPAHDRTHEHVLDRDAGTWISLTDYMGVGDYGSVIEKKRVALKLKLNSGELRYVCPRCEEAMTLASHPITHKSVQRFYFKHRDRSSLCTGIQGLSAAAICARKFAHCKEGEAHKQVKAWLVESMQADPAFSEINQEKHWKDVAGIRWRQPDVQSLWRTERIAFEAQLSTTFLHVITERMHFYERNQGRLLWLFRDLELEHFKLSEDDIFYSNNRNGFCVNRETVALSREHRRFALECVWCEPVDLGGHAVDEVRRQTVFFDQLHFDVSADGVPRTYFFHYDAAIDGLQRKWKDACEMAQRLAKQKQLAQAEARDRALRDELEALFAAFPKDRDKNKRRWRILRDKFKLRGFQLPDEIYRTSGPFYLLMAAYSAKRGEVVACNLGNFISLANSLYDRHKEALWAFSVMMKHYRRAPQMRAYGDMQKWRTRRDTYQRAWKSGDPAFAPDRRFDDLLVFLFPKAGADLLSDPAGLAVGQRDLSGTGASAHP